MFSVFCEMFKNVWLHAVLNFHYINWLGYSTRHGDTTSSSATFDIKRTIQHDITKHLMQIRTIWQ